MRPSGCDYCQEVFPLGAGARNNIQLTRELNGDTLAAELCSSCLEDIAKYIDDFRKGKEA